MLQVGVALLALVGLCLGGDLDSTMMRDFPPRDPKQFPEPSTTKPCGEFPKPATVNFPWSGDVIDTVSWHAIKEGLNKRTGSKFKDFRKMANSSSADRRCAAPFTTKKFLFYWETECPYDIVQITSFYWAKKKRWCYIPFSCYQNAQMVVCKRKFCAIDPRELKPNLNSVCLLNRFMPQTVLAWCPKPKSRADGTVRPRPFRPNKPWKFFYWIDLMLPQCCECTTCRDMRITVWEKMYKSARLTEL